MVLSWEHNILLLNHIFCSIYSPYKHSFSTSLACSQSSSLSCHYHRRESDASASSFSLFHVMKESLSYFRLDEKINFQNCFPLIFFLCFFFSVSTEATEKRKFVCILSCDFVVCDFVCRQFWPRLQSPNVPTFVLHCAISVCLHWQEFRLRVNCLEILLFFTRKKNGSIKMVIAAVIAWTGVCSLYWHHKTKNKKVWLFSPKYALVWRAHTEN